MIIDDYVIPFICKEGLLVLKIRKPTPQELANLLILLRSPETSAWMPEALSEPELSRK